MGRPHSYPGDSLSGGSSLVTPVSAIAVRYSFHIRDQYVSYTDVSFPIPFSPMVGVLTSIHTAFAAVFVGYYVTKSIPAVVNSLFLSKVLFFLFLPLPGTSFVLHAGIQLSRNFGGGSITSFFGTFATDSASPCTMDVAANDTKTVSQVHFDRCGPSLPLLVPTRGFVSEVVASVKRMFVVSVV